MNGITIQIIFLIIAYLLGSIPWALIVGKIVKKIDIREYGSKNMGATNTFRVLGFKYGLLVFFLDAIKAGLIVGIMKYNLFKLDFSTFTFIIHPLFYGLSAFLGHLFPIFAKFKGGKGMACASGIVLAYSPIVFTFGLVAFITTIILSRYVSLSSCVTCVVCLITSIIKPDYDLTLIIILSVLTLVICLKHIPNFKRIITHKESKINFKSIKDEHEQAFILEDEKK